MSMKLNATLIVIKDNVIKSHKQFFDIDNEFNPNSRDEIIQFLERWFDIEDLEDDITKEVYSPLSQEFLITYDGEGEKNSEVVLVWGWYDY